MALKMFNEWTAANHGDFLAGFITALKFIDETVKVEEEITLNPIGVGGKKGLGISISQAEVDETGTAILNVFTRNVTESTAFGMFSVNLTWDSSRGYVQQVIKADFGEDITYEIKPGKLTVYGYKEDETVSFKDNILLFSIKFKTTKEVTVNNPIRLSHVNTSTYNKDIEDILENYTSLGQMRYFEDFGVWSWGFLSPLNNGDGLIVSDKEAEVNNIDEGDNVVTANPSPSMISLGCGSTSAGQVGTVGIFTNSNILDNIEYNKISFDVEVDDIYGILVILDIFGYGKWEIEYTHEKIDGKHFIHVVGVKETMVNGSNTAGAIVYSVNEDDYNIPLVVSNAKFYNTVAGTEYNVANSNGLLTHSSSGDGSEYFPPSQGSGGVSSSSGGGGSSTSSGGPGGMGGYGTIWSGSNQTIWVSVNASPKVPVYLTPGNNDVWFYIPYIFPDTENMEGAIQIESEDYIWIPAGFRLVKKPAPNAPEAALFMNLIDKGKPKVIFDMHIENVKPPTDLDNIIDNFVSGDVFSLSMIDVNIKSQDIIDSFVSSDVFDMLLEKYIPPTDIDGIIDSIASSDVFSATLVPVGINKDLDDIIENIVSSDVFSMLLEEYVPPTDIDGIIDHFKSSDIVDILLQKIKILETNQIEGSTVNDAGAFQLEFTSDYNVNIINTNGEAPLEIIGAGVYESDTIVMLKAVLKEGQQIEGWYLNGEYYGNNILQRFKIYEDTNVVVKLVE